MNIETHFYNTRLRHSHGSTRIKALAFNILLAQLSKIAQEIFDAFKLGRAAIVAKDYEVRDQQADIIKEKVLQI